MSTKGSPFTSSVLEQLPTDACVVWPGRPSRHGYATCIGWFAHRYIYTIVVGPIPAGLVLDHLCRNKMCVNPAHLEPVTLAENSARDRALVQELDPRLYCKNGHEKTPENLYRAPGASAHDCRACNRRRAAQAKARRELASGRESVDRPLLASPTSAQCAHTYPGVIWTPEGTVPHIYCCRNRVTPPVTHCYRHRELDTAPVAPSADAAVAS